MIHNCFNSKIVKEPPEFIKAPTKTGCLNNQFGNDNEVSKIAFS